MKFILDTNIVSELVRKKPNEFVSNWVLKHQKENMLYLSCLTIGEISTGVLKLAKKDQIAAQILQKWVDQLLIEYENKIVGINLAVCMRWAYLMSIDSTNAIDGLLAAQTIENNMVLVTRNIKHFKKFNMQVINPFEEI